MIAPNLFECPESYALWYCLNGGTCFSIRIGESRHHNCMCADGFDGLRCNFKYARRPAPQPSTTPNATDNGIGQMEAARQHVGPSQQLSDSEQRPHDSPAPSLIVAATPNSTRMRHDQQQFESSRFVSGAGGTGSGAGAPASPRRSLNPLGVNAIFIFLAVAMLVTVVHYAYSSFLQLRRQRQHQSTPRHQTAPAQSPRQVQRQASQRLQLYPFANAAAGSCQLEDSSSTTVTTITSNSASNTTTTSGSSIYQWIDEPRAPSAASSGATALCDGQLYLDRRVPPATNASNNQPSLGAALACISGSRHLEELAPFEYVRQVRSHLQSVQARR